MKQLLYPQEVEVYYILPTIRKHLAEALKKRGMPQARIAELLNIQAAAVSQYMSNKRGSQITLKDDIINEIHGAAQRITSTFDVLRETQGILQKIRETGGLCDIHKQFFNAPDNCTPDEVGCNTGGTCYGPAPRICH
ncbi:transcriptional regulator [Candidatus Woesearchaeota archaeon]|nr:transcriptional regulator [Candidatus Woesearchaeota archaeon]